MVKWDSLAEEAKISKSESVKKKEKRGIRQTANKRAKRVEKDRVEAVERRG